MTITQEKWRYLGTLIRIFRNTLASNDLHPSVRRSVERRLESVKKKLRRQTQPS